MVQLPIYISCKGRGGGGWVKGSMTKLASMLGSALCSKNIGDEPIKWLILKIKIKI
jgi:hypothetical protein